MKRTTQLFGVLGLVLLLAACSEPHFMTDTSYRRRVEQDFLQKQALMTQGGFSRYSTRICRFTNVRRWSFFMPICLWPILRIIPESFI